MAVGEAATPEFRNTFEGRIHADQFQVKRAVNNLIINSLAAMRTHGMEHGSGILELVSREEGGWLTLTLRDNAGGLPEGAFEHSQGLGLGICRHIVEAVHHGEMPPPSPNEIGGTTFVLRFPRVEA